MRIFDRFSRNSSGVWNEQREGRTSVRLLASAAVLLFLASGALLAGTTPEIPVVKAELGSCSVDFIVQDTSNKPIYNAQIKVVIKYGFWSLHKTELQVGTNSDGKARFEGLPATVKKALQFVISYKNESKTIEYDPSLRCRTNYTVVLLTK